MTGFSFAEARYCSRQKQGRKFDDVNTAWHQKLLELVRRHADGSRDTYHFEKRAVMRGIDKSEIEDLRFHGEFVDIQIELNRPDMDWLPKYVLSLKKGSREIVGIFATDGLGLYGITCWVNYA